MKDNLWKVLSKGGRNTMFDGTASKEVLEADGFKVVAEGLTRVEAEEKCKELNKPKKKYMPRKAKAAVVTKVVEEDDDETDDVSDE